MPTNLYATGSLLFVEETAGNVGDLLVNARQRNTKPIQVSDNRVDIASGSLHVRRLTASSSLPAVIFTDASAVIPQAMIAPDVFFYVSGTIGLTGSSAEKTVFGGDVVVSGSLSLFGWLNDSGNTALTGSLSVNGPLGVTGSVNVQGNTALTGSLSVNGPSSLTGSLNVNGVTSLTGSLNLNGSFGLTGSLTIINGSLFVSGALVGQRNIRIVTGSWIATLSDDVIITSGLAGNMQLTLPASPAVGQQFSLKDGDGVANTKSHTLNGNGKNIDGAATAVVVNPYTSLMIVYNGTQWSII